MWKDRRLRVRCRGGSWQQSRSAIALRLFLDTVEQNGGEARVCQTSEVELPMYRPDREAPSEAQTKNFSRSGGHAFVLATPDYHGSMSGAMKNFLDYRGRIGRQTLRLHLLVARKRPMQMDQMRTAVRQCYGWSLPYGVD